MNIFTKISLFFLLLLAFYAATPVFAADIFFDAKNQSFAQGEEFLVQVFLNTEEESLNAVEGKITFPTDLLEVREIRNGNSSINFWIEEPHNSQSGAIIFSGITPGGLSGLKEILFSVVLRAKKGGDGAIQADGLRVLRNDGKGTPTIVKISPFQFFISQKLSPISQMIEPIKDTELPEDFKPTIENDPNIFDGKYFLVFATQDKMSGIATYKVREGKWGWFSVVESPYLLIHQSLDREIFIKAIDKAGNERIIKVSPRNPLLWYEDYENWVIIILGIFIIALAIRKLWRKKFI